MVREVSRYLKPAEGKQSLKHAFIPWRGCAYNLSLTHGMYIPTTHSVVPCRMTSYVDRMCAFAKAQEE